MQLPEATMVRERVPADITEHPHVVEIRYRHGVEPGDRFVMESGFDNMCPVKEEELLARGRTDEIRARFDGRVLMPLYQSQAMAFSSFVTFTHSG